MILLSLPLSEAASAGDKSAQAASSRKLHLIRAISTAGAPADSELRGPLVQEFPLRQRTCTPLRPSANPSARFPSTCPGGAKEKTIQVPPVAPETATEVQQTRRPMEQENIIGRKEAAGASRAASQRGKGGGGGAAGEGCLLEGGGRNGEQMCRLPEPPGVCGCV